MRLIPYHLHSDRPIGRPFEHQTSARRFDTTTLGGLHSGCESTLWSWLKEGRDYSAKGDMDGNTSVDIPADVGQQVGQHSVLVRNDNGQRVLTEPIAHCLRVIQFEYNIPMCRLPGLWNAFAILLLGCPLQLTEFWSVATICTRYNPLQEFSPPRYQNQLSIGLSGIFTNRTIRINFR
jgi:hypothetical protein